MDPGGAPMPPELPVCETSPAGAAPHPASRRLMMRPSVDEVRRVYGRFWGVGISLVARSYDSGTFSQSARVSISPDRFANSRSLSNALHREMTNRDAIKT